MEIVSQADDTRISAPPGWPSNRGRHVATRSALPDDAVARICRPSRSAMTSGRARAKGWRLVFERRSPPFIEPLMGWTGGSDTLPQVGLDFPTLKDAIRYAQGQGLACQLPSSALLEGA